MLFCKRNVWNQGCLFEHKLSWLQTRLIHISSCHHKKVPSSLKGKSKSSQEWLTRQLNDPYVAKAHELNYRARSAFKLIEIDDKAKVLKPGQVVVECGAAPGAWTQVIVKRINSDGRVPKKRIGTVVGIDLLPIVPLEGAIFLGGHDFTSLATLQMIRDILERRGANNSNKIDRHDEAMLSGMEEARLTISNDSENNAGTGSEEITHHLQDPAVAVKERLLVDVILSDMAPNATGQRDTDHPRIIKLVEKALEFAITNGRVGGHFLTKVWDGSETKRLESCMSKYYEKVSRYKPPSSRNDSSELFILGKYKK